MSLNDHQIPETPIPAIPIGGDIATAEGAQMTFGDHVIGGLIAPDIAGMLERGERRDAREALTALPYPEVADVLGNLELRDRAVSFRLLPKMYAAEVFPMLSPDGQEQLLAELNNRELADLFNEIDPDDRVDLFEELPGQLVTKLLSLMKPEERRKTQVILGYPSESVGRIMTPDYIAIRRNWTVKRTLRHLRRYGANAESLQVLFVIDEHGKLVDDIHIRQILLAAPHTSMEVLMDQQVISLYAYEDREEAVRVMERYDLPVLPVVDGDGILIGIVTFDDVADVASEETTEDIQKMGGMEALDAPYMNSAFGDLVRKRGVWLLILFFCQMLTVSAMGVFKDAIDKAVILAMFIPLIIATGGNSGSQATSLIIRAMAIGELELKDWLKVMKRELMCGALMGVALGVIGLGRVYVGQMVGWDVHTDEYFLVAIVVGTSLVCVVIWGAVCGSMLPFILRGLGFDPATSSGPFVTTLVDVLGLVIYLTIAMVMLRDVLI